MPEAATSSCAATQYAARLGLPRDVADQRAAAYAPATTDDSEALASAVAADWARSGLMWLSGAPEGPPQRAAHAVPSCAAGALTMLAQCAFQPLPAVLDGACLLSERAAYHGWPRRGRQSVNGQCHMLRTADGWLALNLARTDDLDLLPAWLAPTTLSRAFAADIARGDLAPLQEVLLGRSAKALLARGALLGLPLALPGEATPAHHWHAFTSVEEPARSHRRNHPPRVLDLSALWAGPLASHLLQLAGAEVCRLVNVARIDPSALSLPAFHALLNAGKTVLEIDLDQPEGMARLRAAIAAADIVIESARPRALRQRGIDWREWVGASAGPRLWVRITGHSTADDDDNTRVAFGDDAAIAGGAALVDATGPSFCGDALADPLTGLHAALATLAYWRAGHTGLLGLALAEVTAWCTAAFAAVPVWTPAAATIRGPAPRISPDP